MKRYLIISSFFLFQIWGFAQSDTTLILSEIMFNPQSGNNEFIEIYNRSETQSFDLANYKIIYYTSNADVITSAGFGTVLPPKSYAVILEGDHDFASGIYNSIIPANALKLKITDNSFGTSGMANTSDRPVWFVNVANDTLDRHTYSANNGTGYSEEKIILNRDSLSSNWANSQNFNGTPGFRNSATPLDYDLKIKTLTISPTIPIQGQNVLIFSSISNGGIIAAPAYTIEIFNDANFDSMGSFSEVIYSNSFSNLMPNDSISVNTNIPSITIGNYQIICKVTFNLDEDTTNNKKIFGFTAYPPGNNYNDLIINEIMYAPSSGEPEWIEFLNISDTIIDIKDWSVSDILTTPTKSFITNNSLEIQPEEYFVLARDTSFYNFHSNINYKVKLVNFGSLGNTEDGIIIYDFRNGIIDSFSYKSSLGGKNGYSLERISFVKSTNDSSNWITSLSVNRSTPGEQNSIFNTPSYQKNDFVINEIMFDPDIDNSEFIEFLNLSEDSINVGGWKFVDENQNTSKLSQTSKLIPPNQYFLLIADTVTLRKYNLESYTHKSVLGESSLGLINTGELILLQDARGTTIDSVWYSDKWQNKNFVNTKNISLERINPQINGNDSKNWSSSVNTNGATPGLPNSIFTNNSNRSTNISVSPNPFSPDNDGFEDFAIINYILSQQTSQVRIKIYDSKGRLVQTVNNNQPSGPTGSIVFDGIGDDGAALRIGIYIIFLEALNETEGVVEILKTTVVVARKL